MAAIEGIEFIEQLLENIMKDIKSDMKSKRMYATGKTEELFEVKLTSKGKYLEGQILGPDYLQSLITGRGPTSKSGGGSTTLREALVEWITAKGIVSSDLTTEQLSWAMATHIHKYGNKLYQQGGNTGILQNHIPQSRLDAAVNAFGDANVNTIFVKMKDVLS